MQWNMRINSLSYITYVFTNQSATKYLTCEVFKFVYSDFLLKSNKEFIKSQNNDLKEVISLNTILLNTV